MKRILSPIGIFGMIYLVAGIILNVRMFINDAWPTVLFFILMVVGLVYMGLSFLKWDFKRKYLIQVLIGLIPLILFIVLK